MKKYKLHYNHPTVQKFEQLCSLAEQLGINISVYGDRIIVQDNEESFFLEDIDNEYGSFQFPIGTEYKLVFYKDKE